MLHKTIWSPDTCGCEIEFEWDDAEPAEARSHRASRIIKACPAHALHGDMTAHFAAVLEENRRKNRSLSLTQDKLALTDTQARAIAWSFDDSGTLHLELGPGVDAQAKADHQAELDKAFGKDKVKVH